jgi:hypothetical protein
LAPIGGHDVDIRSLPGDSGRGNGRHDARFRGRNRPLTYCQACGKPGMSSQPQSA